jgi:hypothetical protein
MEAAASAGVGGGVQTRLPKETYLHQGFHFQYKSFMAVPYTIFIVAA